MSCESTSDLIVAVVGCLHGELERMYNDIEEEENKQNIKVDLVLCCGDFQSVRNEKDLQSMAVPQKFRKMMDFYKYYNGSKVAPILTLFIGGNHEAALFLWELPFGGWVAKNIYYLGYSGVINFGGIRIGGVSGIFKDYSFKNGHTENPPFSSSSMRSFYHIREIDLLKLKTLSNIDILLSHDWPCGIWEHGNCKKLLKYKPFFKSDIESKRLGCSFLMDLLNQLTPTHYFCAHLHVCFKATVKHQNKSTSFLALDKALKRRKYLEILNLGPALGPKILSHDPTWLEITRLFSPFHTSLSSSIPQFTPTDEDIKATSDKFGNLTIDRHFEFFDVEDSKASQREERYLNPQTLNFCEKLSIDNPCIPKSEIELSTFTNPDEIEIS